MKWFKKNYRKLIKDFIKHNDIFSITIKGESIRGSYNAEFGSMLPVSAKNITTLVKCFEEKSIGKIRYFYITSIDGKYIEIKKDELEKFDLIETLLSIEGDERNEKLEKLLK